MKNLLTQLLTERDNQTHDIVRWYAFIAFVIANALEIYQIVWCGTAFDLTNYGVGLGALAAAVGAALRLKQDTEPLPIVSPPTAGERV